MSKDRSRFLGVTHEREHGELNIYGPKHRGKAESLREKGRQLMEGTVAISAKIGTAKRAAAGLPALNEQLMRSLFEDSLREIPLHEDPTLAFSSASFARLPDAGALVDVAVLPTTEVGAAAHTRFDGDTSAIVVSHNLMLALAEWNELFPWALSIRRREDIPERVAEIGRLRAGLKGQRQPPSRFMKQAWLNPPSTVFQHLQILLVVLHEAGHIVLRKRGTFGGGSSLEEERAADDLAFRWLVHLVHVHEDYFRELIPRGAGDVRPFIADAVHRFCAFATVVGTQALDRANTHPSPRERFERFVRVFGAPPSFAVPRVGQLFTMEALSIMADAPPIPPMDGQSIA